MAASFVGATGTATLQDPSSAMQRLAMHFAREAWSSLQKADAAFAQVVCKERARLYQIHISQSVDSQRIEFLDQRQGILQQGRRQVHRKMILCQFWRISML